MAALLFSAASVSADAPAPNWADEGRSRQRLLGAAEANRCYARNDCRTPFMYAKSLEICAANDGHSWRDAQGVCHPDLAGDVYK